MSFQTVATGNDLVIDALWQYVSRIGSQRGAAKKIGVDYKTLKNWLRGDYMMPEWFVGELGFKRVETRQVVQHVSFIPLDGPVGVRPA
jgi:hypothetical protein